MVKGKGREPGLGGKVGESEGTCNRETLGTKSGQFSKRKDWEGETAKD